MKKASIIIPAYNESTGIEKTLTELLEQLDLDSVEVLVIDDGSMDGTAEIVQHFPMVRLICHDRNRGYGSAIRTGVMNSEGEIIAWYDSDGQHRPVDLLKILDEMEKNNLDYCIGIRGEGSYVDHMRIFGKAVLRGILRLVGCPRIADFNSGLRAFKRPVLLRYLDLLPKRFGASTVTTLLMLEENYVGMEIPIIARERVGKSSVRQVRDGLRTIGLIIMIILMFHPLRVFGSIGIILIIAGILYGGIRALAWHAGLPVFAAVLIILGIQFCCFGLLSYQISCVRKIGRREFH